MTVVARPRPQPAPRTPGHRDPADPGPRAAPGTARAWLFSMADGMRDATVDEVAGGVVDGSGRPGDGDRVAWVDATGYGARAFETLAGRLGLAEGGARPARVPRPRPRLEAFADHALATILIPDLREHDLRVAELDVLITDRVLLSAHDGALPFLGRVAERAAQHPGLIAQDSAFLLFLLLDEWIRLVEMLTEELDERIEDMEDRAIRDTSDTFLDDLVDFKELAFDLFQAVDRHHAVFDAVLNPDFPFVSGATVEGHYRDLARRFERRVAAIRGGKEAITNALTIFSSSTAYRTNRIVVVLTMVSTLLLPITMIFSFFGVNFTHLGLFSTPAFVAMWAAVVTVTTLIVAVFRRTGMLAVLRRGG